MAGDPGVARSPRVFASIAEGARLCRDAKPAHGPRRGRPLISPSGSNGGRGPNAQVVRFPRVLGPLWVQRLKGSHQAYRVRNTSMTGRNVARQQFSALG
jgi:hypothetical protein